MPEIVYKEMKLSELSPADYNPRTISDEALEGLGHSIDRFGLVQPLVWNKRTGSLVGGHQRMKALREQGKKTAHVAIVDLSLSEEKALNVTLNNEHISGEYNDDLRGILLELRSDDRHLFRDVALDKLLEDEARDVSDPDNAMELPSEADTITKPGDLWILGEHRLLCGSSTEHSDVMRLMGDVEGAQCMWTDPPYGVDYVSKGATKEHFAGQGGKLANDKAKDVPEMLRLAMGFAFDYVLRPASGVYVAHPPGELRRVFDHYLVASGFLMRQELVWVKSQIALGRLCYHYRHEPIWYGLKPGDKTFGRPIGAKQKAQREGWYGDNSQATTFFVDKPHASKLHPTMKPVGLIAPMLANSTRVGDWVYEPFCGSGSTLIAANGLRRRCLAMELSPGYCDVIVQRFRDVTGGKVEKG